jgi:hypothetical protein
MELSDQVMANHDIRVHPLAPVVAFDLDGTLGDYYAHFEWFASLYTQRTVKAHFEPEMQGDYCRALGMEKEMYRDIKLAYRQGGMKRCMPVFRYSRALVSLVRTLGVQVWICTTRPYLRLDNIDPDTRFWLDRNIGRVDGLLYGEEKYQDLVDIVGRDRVLAIYDDLPENIIDANKMDIPCIMRSGPQNAWFSDYDPSGISWMETQHAELVYRNIRGLKELWDVKKQG